jgi:hypothetical protein
MATIRFTDVQEHPTEFLDLTSLALDEFQRLCRKFCLGGHAGAVAPV